MDHIIHTQLLDISISDVSRASEVQQSLSDHFWNDILPEINKLFDELCNDNEVLLIQQLEIDLGKILYKDVIKKNMIPNWIQQLREQILQFIEPSQTKVEKTQRKLTIHQHLLENWIFYMKNGYLPWSINELPKQWERQILEQLASDYNSILLFKKAAASNSKMIVRIIRQHDESFLVSLLETILAESQKQLIHVINELTNILPEIASSSNLIRPQKSMIRESIWSLLLERSIAKPEEVKTYQWIPLFLKNATELKWIDIHQNKSEEKNLMQIIDRLNISVEFKYSIHAEIIKLVNSNAGPNTIKNEADQFSITDIKSNDLMKRVTVLKWIDLLGDKFAYKDLMETIDRLNISVEFKDSIHAEIIKLVNSNVGLNTIKYEADQLSLPNIKSKDLKESSEQILKRILSEYLKNNEKESITQNQQQNLSDTDEVELYFCHVGLILLHPFIILLFKRLGFMEAGQFVSNVARLKAIYLLHYIATGSIEAKEFELAIPKLFCGELLTNVLDPCPQFNTEELEEAEMMLEGSIAQWKPGIFSTSALRHNFLQRSGFWKRKNDQIILQLEKSSIDIVLKTFPIPWNLSIVKFPWLKKLIIVEWV